MVDFLLGAFNVGVDISSGVLQDAVGEVKNEANALFNMSSFSSEVVAVELLFFSSAGVLFFDGESLLYADQKSLGEFSFPARHLKNWDFADLRAAKVLFRALVYLDHASSDLSSLACLKSLSFLLTAFMRLFVR